ncbi:MAG TPA: hypothetical protein VM619_10995 [Luteimonas sp.]|nr:hypothetical protein [Luteimonas sp.]
MTVSIPKRKLDLGKRGDALLDPVVDLLLAHGNRLAETYRWGANPTGYFCLLDQPIDFDLVESSFDVPDTVTLDRRLGIIDYGYGTALIRQHDRAAA